MGLIEKILFGSLAAVAAATLSVPAVAQQQQKPNIVVIMPFLHCICPLMTQSGHREVHR